MGHPSPSLTARPADPAASVAPPDRLRVTVVVPTYNRREGLRRCLDGLFACDVDGLAVDVRIVDDGSGDGTGEMVASLPPPPAGMRVHYHRQENAGAAAARNCGVRDAETDLVLFIDDDCVPDRGWIRAMLDEPWPEGAGAIGGRIISTGEETWVARYCRHVGFDEFPPPDGSLRFVNTANCAYLRRAILEVGGFEELFRGACGEDHDLARTVVARGYRLEYRAGAVVHHYPRETFDVLVRTYTRRGYAEMLRKMLWRKSARMPAPLLLRSLAGAATASLLVVLIPFRAAALAIGGVPARDALPFAYMDWLRVLCKRRGALALLRNVLAGRQSLESSRSPRMATDPS
jgi:glycosyltransferase involved in cell wall biosynthesis